MPPACPARSGGDRVREEPVDDTAQGGALLRIPGEDPAHDRRLGLRDAHATGVARALRVEQIAINGAGSRQQQQPGPVTCRTAASHPVSDERAFVLERGLDVDHSTVFRWVQRYAPEINKRVRQHLKMSGTSYRVDETYIKVGKRCKYLYRAVDKEGQTIEFMLSAKRDVSAAKRFFKKMMRAEHRRLPFSISVENNAAYPEALSTSQREKIVPKDCKLMRVK
jgi:hypothetical protein